MLHWEIFTGFDVFHEFFHSYFITQKIFFNNSKPPCSLVNPQKVKWTQPEKIDIMLDHWMLKVLISPQLRSLNFGQICHTLIFHFHLRVTLVTSGTRRKPAGVKKACQVFRSNQISISWCRRKSSFWVCWNFLAKIFPRGRSENVKITPHLRTFFITEFFFADKEHKNDEMNQESWTSFIVNLKNYYSSLSASLASHSHQNWIFHEENFQLNLIISWAREFSFETSLIVQLNKQWF